MRLYGHPARLPRIKSGVGTIPIEGRESANLADLLPLGGGGLSHMGYPHP